VQDHRPKARFVVGLGNPGRRYAKTRHNVGFMVLAELRRRGDFGWGKRKFHARRWSGRLAGQALTLLAPQTYMNRSGLAVSEMAAFYRADPTDVLVVMDDMALPLGVLRARARGSAGGHNGLADIISALGTNQVPRLRVGIGAARGARDAAGHVLSEFAKSEKPVVDEAIQRAADAVEDWIGRGIAFVMDNYNKKASDNSSTREGGKGL